MNVELKRNRWVVVSVLLLGAIIAFLNETALTTALATIMRDLHISADKGQWLTTAFMLVSGIMIPMTAFLIDKFSTRQLFFIAMGCFALGTILGAFAINFDMLLIARIIQAIGAGIMMPLTQVVFLYIFAPEERGSAMGILGIVISFAPAIGPTLAGWIVVHFAWRDIFFMSFPIAILDLILAFFILENVKEAEKAKIDILSAITSAIGFGGLLYGFGNVGSYSFTNPEVYIPLLVGCVSLIYFVIRQVKILDTPFLNLAVLKNKTFTLSTLIVLIVFAGFLASETILPLYIQDARGYSAFDSGLTLMPGAIAIGIMSPITGKLFDKYGGRLLTLIGLTCTTVGTFALATLSTTTPLYFVTVVYTLRLFGIGMFMMPLTTMSLNVLKKSLYSHGAAVSNTLRQIVSSIGTALLVAVMTFAANHSGIKNSVQATIHGMNVSFFIAGIFTLIALIIAFFVVKNNYTIERE
ncbi:MAG: MDR family MFS transporter [Clostridium perfringens]|nr:MDR family MFS transporter [Clostridium perfringens]